MYFGDCLAWHVIHEDGLHKRNREDGVTSATCVIHVGAGRGAVCVAACNALLQTDKDDEFLCCSLAKTQLLPVSLRNRRLHAAIDSPHRDPDCDVRARVTHVLCSVRPADP